MPILFPEGRPMALIGSESRDRLAADPSPRLRLGIFNGRQPARESLGRQWGRFPFPLPPRTIGEQKAKVKDFSKQINWRKPFGKTQMTGLRSTLALIIL